METLWMLFLGTIDDERLDSAGSTSPHLTARCHAVFTQMVGRSQSAGTRRVRNSADFRPLHGLGYDVEVDEPNS